MTSTDVNNLLLALRKATAQTGKARDLLVGVEGPDAVGADELETVQMGLQEIRRFYRRLKDQRPTPAASSGGRLGDR